MHLSMRYRNHPVDNLSVALLGSRPHQYALATLIFLQQGTCSKGQNRCLPKQALDFIAQFIGEDIQLSAKGIVAELQLIQRT